jgi:hypothetical protein
MRFEFKPLMKLADLKEGDIVRHVNAREGNRFVVSGNYGNRATAIGSVDITNPPEWLVLRRIK